MTLGAALISQGCAGEPAANGADADAAGDAPVSVSDGAEAQDAVASDALFSDVFHSDALALDSGARDANVTADGGGASCPAPSALRVDWYVSPTGTESAAGSREAPMSLQRALSAAGPVRAGHRVRLLPGTYAGRFTSALSGTSTAPIVFAAEPSTRVTFDSNVAANGAEAGLVINGTYTEFHGIEVTSSATDRSLLIEGVAVYGAGSKLINCVIHDTAQGVGFWSSAVDGELGGNVIYNNGYPGPTRGHGHGVYTQNATGTKRLVSNVFFFGYAYGLHAYTEGGSLRGFELLNNVWFRTGASLPGASIDGTSEGCLLGGLQPVGRARLEGNLSFAPTVSARGVQLGWGGSVQNEDITLRGNYFVGRLSANGAWRSGTLSRNVVHGALSGIDPAMYPDNTWSAGLPSGTKVELRRNPYDATRAELVVYNWAQAATVAVDPSALLTPGTRWELFSVYDLFGAPVASGTWTSGTLSVPMGSKAPPQPNGAAGAITGADDPGRAFGVFVLRSSCSLRP